jgi:hypothetical protein
MAQKEKILKSKANLPPPVIDPLKPPGLGKQEPGPGEVIPPVISEIKPIGILKNLSYAGLNFFLARKKTPLLQEDERQMLGDPLDRLEIEILRILPDYLKEQFLKSGPFGGPILEIVLAGKVIVDRRKKTTEKPATGKEDVQVEIEEAPPAGQEQPPVPPA